MPPPGAEPNSSASIRLESSRRFADAWLVSLPLRDASIVDIVWGLGFVAVGWVTAARRRWTAWGCCCW